MECSAQYLWNFKTYPHHALCLSKILISALLSDNHICEIFSFIYLVIYCWCLQNQASDAAVAALHTVSGRLWKTGTFCNVICKSNTYFIELHIIDDHREYNTWIIDHIYHISIMNNSICICYSLTWGQNHL